MSLSKHQQCFIDYTIIHPKVKQAISSKEEYSFKNILSAIGQENKDWYHQKPFVCEEEKVVAVADFAFPDYNLIIELDGPSHKQKNQHKKDKERDNIFFHNDYEVIRIKTPIPEEKRTYWKVFIEETLKQIKEAEAKKGKTKKRKKAPYTDKEFEQAFKRYLANEAVQ
jgi:hypothetical protein